VPSTTFTPFAAGGAATNPLTSFTTASVGVILEITPRVTYEGEIVLDLGREQQRRRLDQRGRAVLPTFGSRKVRRDCGCAKASRTCSRACCARIDRQGPARLPGHHEPAGPAAAVLEQRRADQQTDIVILLTPRIVRTHELTEENLRPIYIGTQQNIGLTGPPPLIAPQEPEQVPDAGAAGAGDRTWPAAGVRLCPTGTAPTGAQPPPGSSPFPAPTTAPHQRHRRRRRANRASPPPSCRRSRRRPPRPNGTAATEQPRLTHGADRPDAAGHEFRMGAGPTSCPSPSRGVSRSRW
jgi:hypothetical protein